MNRRQSDELENNLELLSIQPMIRFSKSRLRQIFGIERISKNTWREIFERIPEELEVNNLKIIENFDDIYVIRADSLKDAVDYC